MKFFIVASALVALACGQMFDMKKSFDLVDTDKDGFVEHEEFDAVYKGMDNDMSGDVNATEFIISFMKTGMSSDGALYIFFRMDNNSDSVIDHNEVHNAFHYFDKDMDDKISFMEHSKAMNKTLEHLAIAKAIGEKLSAMVDAADVNKDGMLTGDEMWSVVSGGDMDGDGMLNKTEFTTYWMAKTGDNEDRSTRLFKIFDGDMDGMFGGDAEKEAIYMDFDYNKDKVVSDEEFMNSMLFLFAKIMGDIKADHKKMKMMMKMELMSQFNNRAIFDMADNDTDGMISKMEFEAIYHKFDDNMDDSVNITEFVTHYMKTGVSDKGSLYIFFRMDGNEDLMISHSEVDDTFDAFDMDDDDMVSFNEYETVMNMTMKELLQAAITGERLEVMFNKADANMDGELTRDEMKSTLDEADTDKDGSASEDEFKKYWMDHTGEPENRADLLFGYFDVDNDGFFGDGNEFTLMFDGFDYDDDDLVSKDEFDNSMLFLFAKIIGDLEAAQKAKDVVGYFF